MSSSRRNFLALAGAGAAGAGLSSAIGLIGADTVGLGSPAAVPQSVPASLSGSLVAYIDDVHGDEVSLMIGDDEVVLKDSALVARIASAAAESKASAAL